ncbi:hypothetical protein M0812_09882 [Anaeramoeba flamelloides]|uniref:Uncharacterized protein n=1 Tax=Anaeramoeba flamelloides TaxID=1746091 RepID=A0AAV7ZU63_9EUKA|nr:hypothetical protein M0812_09882 [Anaeramoeba flamelloides]
MILAGMNQNLAPQVNNLSNQMNAFSGDRQAPSVAHISHTFLKEVEELFSGNEKLTSKFSSVYKGMKKKFSSKKGTDEQKFIHQWLTESETELVELMTTMSAQLILTYLIMELLKYFDVKNPSWAIGNILDISQGLAKRPLRSTRRTGGARGRRPPTRRKRK